MTPLSSILLASIASIPPTSRIPSQELEHQNEETFHEIFCLLFVSRFIELFVKLDHEYLCELHDLFSNSPLDFIEKVFLLLYLLGYWVKVQRLWHRVYKVSYALQVIKNRDSFGLSVHDVVQFLFRGASLIKLHN